MLHMGWKTTPRLRLREQASRLIWTIGQMECLASLPAHSRRAAHSRQDCFWTRLRFPLYIDTMAGLDASHQGGEDVQQLVKFVTKLPAELRVPEAPVAVPANLARYGLSQIINHLLALDPVRPFDFLINGELLRQSLLKHLQAKQISTEAVLEVEYIPAVLPPKPKEQYSHDDWVSCLASLASGALASGCYDGIVRVWASEVGEGGASGEPALSFAAHKGAIKAAATVCSRAAPGGQLLLTAGADMVARVWRGAAERGPGRPEAVAVLRGHSEGIEAAAVSGDGGWACTGGWDSKLMLWQSGDALLAAAEAAAGGNGEAAAANKAAASKKRKVGAEANGVAAAPHEEAPRGEFSGHTQCVTALAWPSAGTLVSGSWDHSVRTWDVETQVNTETLNHNKAVYCVAAAPGSGGTGLVAFGGAERALRAWDPRTRAGEGLALRSLTSHTDWISALAWHPASAHHVVSASHDGSLKLWDLRAAIPLHTLPRQHGGEKVLCTAWAGAGLVASGGADCKLRTAELELPGAR